MPLLRKELRALVPFIALVLFVCMLNVADELLTNPPDMRPLEDTLHSYVAPGTGNSVLLFLLIFALGSGLLVREQDEGTMEFLDSLPVSRTRVFWTKFLLASLVLMLLPLTNILIAWTLHALSRTSLDPSFHLQALATSFFLAACQTTVFLALALLLSFLRRFAWMVVALLVWAFLLVQHFYPGIAVLNVLDLTVARFEGQRWLLPIEELKFQMPLAVMALLAAWFMFAGVGDRIASGYKRLTQSRAGMAVLTGAAALTVVLVLAMIVYVAARRPAQEAADDTAMTARATYASWTTAHGVSRFYAFVYPANLSDRAGQTIADADAVHERVRQFLGAAPSSATIAVDMTGSAPRHAGVAYWNTVRMNLADIDDPGYALAVLGHETVHVFVDRISDERLNDAFNSTRFFNEGLASYLEHRLFGFAAAKSDLSVAAVMRQRGEVEFKELIDDQLLRRQHDLNLVYPLGEVFVASVVDRYGDGAPGALLRAFARKDRPKQLHGMALWQDAFQSAGYSLESALDAFYARLDALVAEQRGFITSLSRPRGAVHYRKGAIGIKPVWTPVKGWMLVCRFRQSEDAEERDYLRAYLDDDEVFWMDRDSLPGATFWFQIGVHEIGSERTIWERWSEVRKP